MQKHPDLTLRRLQGFASERQLRGRLYPERIPVQLSVFSAPRRISYEEALRGDYRPAAVGEQFGPLWSTHWFHLAIQVPQAWQGREVHLLWDSASEACVWQDGVPMQGLTGARGGWAPEKDAIRQEYILTHQARGGESLALYIEMACNGLFGVDEETGRSPIGLLTQAEIAVFDRDAWDLLWDFVTIAEMARHLPPNTPRAGQALSVANAIVNTVDLNDRQTWAAGRILATDFLSAPNGAGQHNLSAIGHAHLDTAWLWPYDETKRKAYRTFATALRYMELYPDYKFAASSAQHFAWIKEQQPDLYRQIKERVREERFVIVGGSWVEPDCNIPSGESLVRHFLYGQRFFQQEFGAPCHEFWNPDVFGYSAALPQILKGVGIRYFLTQKLSWNQFNKLPHHTFLWEGLDGSRVLTHFPPADHYGTSGTVKELIYNVSNFKDHDRSNESYFLFGLSDGGGGPTLPMIERLLRARDVDGLPRVEMRSAQEFFERCEADLQAPAVWAGELYFEMHRGTYTTQARCKRDNRRCEFLLRDVELLATLAGAPYPAEEIEILWKKVLINQFHDVIPGSSIAEVYADAHAIYDEVLTRGDRLRRAAIDALVGEDAGPNLCVVNTLAMPRLEVVELPEGYTSVQQSAEGQPLGLVASPGIGYTITARPLAPDAGVRVTEAADAIVLENAFVKAVLGTDGRLVSLRDLRAGREVIAPGETANRLLLYDDQPATWNDGPGWDAWDVEVYHLEKYREVSGASSAQVVEAGPLRAAVAFDVPISPASTLRQVVSLTAVSPRLDFTCRVDWHERHKFLKVEFPFNLRAQQATYEVQFGHVQRPTHFNTSWDMARFEVCAHKWADLSEPDYGVALLNDSKYGYATHGHIMRLSLLRSPAWPDRQADRGEHTFRYALFPHTSGPQAGGVIEEAYRFNEPVMVRATSRTPSEMVFFDVSRPGLILETVKQAEDTSDVIVRLVEAYGTRGTARLTSALPVQAVTRCNLLEEDQSLLSWQDNGVTFEVTPFEIVTLKLVLPCKAQKE